MKEMTKSSSKSSSFDSKSSKEITPRSNNSSVSQNKSLEKIEKKSSEEKFSEKLSKKESNKSSSHNNEIPQMAMLQGVQPVFVNQQAQAPISDIKVEGNVDLGVKVSDQTQPVLKFLKAMQENFGISPQQVMKALGELDPQVMMQSPQQAMTPLFEKLGIQPKQFTKAQILFTEMLTDMEKVQPEAFKGKLAAGAGASAGLGSQMLNSSELPAQIPSQVMEKPMVAPKSTLDQLIEQKIARRAVEPQNLKGALSQAPQVQQPQMNLGQVFNVEPTLVPTEDLVAISKLQELDPNLRIEDIKINPNKVTEQFASSTPILGGGAAVTALATATNDQQKDMSEEEMKEAFADQMAQMPADKKLDGQFAVNKLAPATAAALSDQSNQLSNENVEKLISGSQALIKKGGGEMKIQLNPEGLGKIHLNIKVQDGQVGVQMMADTHEAKKLLETSMSELKVGLADHKLNLNQVKVDVSEQASQNMNQSHDFKREEARDFLGQFRQFNESFRRGANDLSGARAYRKEAQPATPDINPIETKRSNSSNSSNSKGLYLVA